MKKLLFLNGSAPAMTEVSEDDLRRAFPDVDVKVHNCRQYSEGLYSEVRQIVEEEKPDLILGTDEGGTVAQRIRGYCKVLVNPSFFLPNGSCGSDLQQLLEQFNGVKDYDKENTYAFFDDESSEVEINYDLYHRFYPIGIHYPSGADTGQKFILKLIIPLIRELLK